MGSWRFDADRSASERKAESGKDPELLRGRGKPAVGMDGRSRGGGGAAAGGAGGGGGGARGGPAGLGPMTPYGRPARQLTISQSDSTITITPQEGQAEVLYLDGRKSRTEFPGTEPIEVVAKWKGGKLTVERKFGSTGTIREVYSLGADGKELTLDMRFSGAELTQPIDMKRVYDLSSPRN